MMARLLAAQSPWGRLRLDLYIRWKRIAWALVVNGTLFLKRFLDVVISLVALLLLAPVFAFLALLLRRDGGPAFFSQTRIGLHGREFRMHKFRTMVDGAEALLPDLLPENEKTAGVTFKLRNDPRITPLGRCLRRCSLDEIPQFWNVLVGEMSLVGPRPPTPREVALYSQADRRRLLARPGLTCLWQVGEREGRLFEIGDRNSIDFPEQVELDIRYIESQSLLKDLAILAKTVPAILLGKGL